MEHSQSARLAVLAGVLRRHWRVARRLRASAWYVALWAGTFSLATASAFGQPAPNARPTGGVVVAGRAAISYTAPMTTINVVSSLAVINWQSFDIGSQQQVVIAGPGATAAVLNRVRGTDPSEIAGRLTSNGEVYLVNGAGATYDHGAQIDASGFVSTGTDITNANFMNGKLVFDTAGNGNATIANKGNITVHNEGVPVSSGGILALIAPSVANSGVLEATVGGNVALAAASRFQLNPLAKLLVDVTSALSTTSQSDLVVNTGTIRAAGGKVLLRARVAPNVGGSIEVGGTIKANTLAGHRGTVVVLGSGAGAVVQGTLDTTGAPAGAVGGSVQILGSPTELAATSTVDVSGAAGGGVVAIGTNLARARGGPGVTGPLSDTTLVDLGAQVNADALAAGNGGRVVVLASSQTNMAGAITAHGGNASGNGGFVEISGGTLSLTGTVDVSAPFGVRGTVLLDPFDFIVTKPVANALGAHLLAGGSRQLIIRADHDIEVDAPINGRGGVPGTQLVFDAGNQVRLKTDVLTNDAPIEIDAGAGGVLVSPGVLTSPVSMPASSR